MDNQGYTGFTFNGKHSSEFNIKRTSDGDRYNENLLPTIQDKTVQIPGADGTYFYGSYFTQRVFNVSFAFDSLTEGQLAALKSHFGDKKIHELIFDEAPYKKYMAKVTGSATFKYIPFAEGATNRVYKGEGTLQFTAYDPYARVTGKYLNTPSYQSDGKEFRYDADQVKEWQNAAKLLANQGNFDKLTEPDAESGECHFPLYNPGEKDSDFILPIYFIPHIYNELFKVTLGEFGAVVDGEKTQAPWGLSAKPLPVNSDAENAITLNSGITIYCFGKDIYQTDENGNKDILQRSSDIQFLYIPSGAKPIFNRDGVLINGKNMMVSDDFSDNLTNLRKFIMFNFNSCRLNLTPTADEQSAIIATGKYLVNNNQQYSTLKPTPIPAFEIWLYSQYGTSRLRFKEIPCDENSTHIAINTKLNIVEGYQSSQKTGKVYNKYIDYGSFFKIPICTETDAKKSFKLGIRAIDKNDNINLVNRVKELEYDYYYL